MGGRGSNSSNSGKEYRGVAIERNVGGRQRYRATINGETYGFNTPQEARQYIDAVQRSNNVKQSRAIEAIEGYARGEGSSRGVRSALGNLPSASYIEMDAPMNGNSRRHLAFFKSSDGSWGDIDDNAAEPALIASLLLGSSNVRVHIEGRP